jgi:peptidoglycan hydrolase FlgJ
MRVSSNPSALNPSIESDLRASKLISSKLSDLPLSDRSITDSPLSERQGDLASSNKVGGQEELQETFQDFVGQTFFGQMIASMRATQEDAPYFHGGRAEKIFQGQLDQVLAEELSDSSAAQFSDPMFKLFQLHRQ